MNIKNEVLTVIPKILLSGAVAAALLQSRAIKILILGSSHFLLVLIVHRSVTRKKVQVKYKRSCLRQYSIEAVGDKIGFNVRI